MKMSFMIRIKIEKVYELYTSDGFIARGKAKADGEADRNVGAKPKLTINDVQGTVRKAPSAHCAKLPRHIAVCALERRERARGRGRHLSWNEDFASRERIERRDNFAEWSAFTCCSHRK